MTSGYRWLAVAILSLIAGAAAMPMAPAAQPRPASQSTQRSFATPQAAVDALVATVRASDTASIGRILGAGSDRLIHSGDPVADRRGRERFVAAYEKRSRIEPEGDDRATLLIGEKDWPFPFPLVKRGERWRFDTQAGAQAVIDRRIGRNELAAIQVCLAYVDAQREYAATAGNGDGLHRYATQLVSSPGKKDGLYWPTPEGQPASPLGPLAAKAKKEGYGKSGSGANEPYHGYLYRILTAQGPDAPGGVYAYVVKGRMIGGFGLVAYPARWGASGVMTFIVNHDGVVYQKNLGPRSSAIAGRMTTFDPDPSWTQARP